MRTIDVFYNIVTGVIVRARVSRVASIESMLDDIDIHPLNRLVCGYHSVSCDQEEH